MTHVPGDLLYPTASTRPTSLGGDRAAASWPDDQTLGDLRESVDRHLADYLTSQRGEYLRHPIFTTLYDDVSEFVCRPGKRIRPVLFLLANRVFGEAENAFLSESLLSVSVSLELLHGFILVHDDIIDRAETRRGRPSLHRQIESRLSSFTDRHRAGRNLALVMGDILFALAQRCLLNAELPGELRARLGGLLLGCMVDTGFGEVADIVHSTRDVAKVSADEIEEMYCLKTTCYTVESPLTMAATLHGVDADGIAALSRVARPAGLAFQVQNDLQEFARFEVSDAEVPADILEGKKTLLVRTAFDLLNDNDRGFLQMCFSTGVPTEGTVSKARELIVKSGAVSVLARRVEELFAKAEYEIRHAPFEPAVQQGLGALIELVKKVAVR